MKLIQHFLFFSFLHMWSLFLLTFVDFVDKRPFQVNQRKYLARNPVNA